ncbi:YheC/YheD family endospore coat-associated protein [Paenibacillus glycanilyticus]|uniref:Endospore coat-associated protein YheD n=1 Tax=Paenibacillus glycanilyticus TaxID=126569 RepID=A0ABQ6NQZ2_9BACL|nr:YheC/YheD family protein [Paenibacillus glycanilyticus]GMK46954.1 endospore coat-associated protein YheD [Paenibacillus glycanilyticus]
MQKSKVAVQLISSGMLPEDTIMLGEAYLKQWHISHSVSIVLRFGTFKKTVKVIPVPKYDGMRINQSLARQMGILSSTSLRLSYDSSSSTLRLGPLIGVLISRDYPSTPDKPFGTITMFCKELVDGCANQGAHVYFFTPNHVSGSSDKQIEGWTFANGWKRAKLPLPDVVNNRLTSRKLESRAIVQQFFKEIKSTHHASVFNEKFLDKMEVFDALKKDESVRRYLPESHFLRNYTTLKSMCSRYGNVFLKPSKGSLGKGIIRVTKLEGDIYQAHFTTGTGTRRQVYPNLVKLFSSISTKMKTIKYQAQQGLNLIEIQKRPVDFRAVVQKNATGKWTLTSVVARTASSQHFVSNLARGGTLSTVNEAVARSNIFAGKEGASKRLRTAALTIAEGIDKHIPAHFGELGIDLALDTNGRVWLLEVNSKPSKSDNTPLNQENDNKIRPSVRNVIQYSRFLSGF